MRNWKKTVIGCGVAFGAHGVAAAGPVVDVGIARSAGRFGAEASLGLRLGLLGFAITPSVGAFARRSADNRYVEEPDPAGGTRCRDSRNGDLDRDLFCENANLTPFGRVEATFAIPLVAEVGAGVRMSKSETMPYATAAMPFFPGVKLKGNVGDGYYALGLRVGF